MKDHQLDLMVKKFYKESLRKKPKVPYSPPVVTDDKDYEEYKQERNLMTSRFPTTWRGFCDEWLSAASMALIDSMKKLNSNTHETENFAVALGGNLVWALAVLLPEAAIVYVSVAGAVVGSGTFSRTSPSPTKYVTDILQMEANMIERVGTTKLFRTVADEAYNRNITEAQKQDELLWLLFAPTINYGNRRLDMKNIIEVNIDKLYYQFDSEYERKRAIEFDKKLDGAKDTLIFTGH